MSIEIYFDKLILLNTLKIEIAIIIYSIICLTIAIVFKKLKISGVTRFAICGKSWIVIFGLGFIISKVYISFFQKGTTIGNSIGFYIPPFELAVVMGLKNPIRKLGELMNIKYAYIIHDKK